MILYLHGFNSTPDSRKAQTLHDYMRRQGLGALFACPRLPHRPEQAVDAIERELAQRDPRSVTLVGSSLGGFYATWFAERRNLRAVLIQPAVTPYLGSPVFEIDRPHASELEFEAVLLLGAIEHLAGQFGELVQ